MDSTSELIGIVANIATDNGVKLKLGEVAAILNICGYDTSWVGEPYTRPDALVRKAHEEYKSAGDHSTVNNIETAITRKDGNMLSF